MVILFIGEKMIMQIFTYKISYTTELVSPHCFKEFQDFIFNKKLILSVCSRCIYIYYMLLIKVRSCLLTNQNLIVY